MFIRSARWTRQAVSPISPGGSEQHVVLIESEHMRYVDLQLDG